MTDLADGIYTVLIADDISLNYWAARGQPYSGHTVGCSTTDPPVTAITSNTFTVGPPASPIAPAPDRAATSPAGPIAPSAAAPAVILKAPSTSQVKSAR
jgi:hypothetical protein